MKLFTLIVAIVALAKCAYGQQDDNPFSVPITYWGEALTTGNPFPPSSTFSFGTELGGANTKTVSSTPGGVLFSSESTPTTVNVIPGKEYTVQVTGSNVAYVRPIFALQPGNVIYINGYPNVTIASPPSFSFTFRLQRIGDISAGLGTRGGEATSIVSDKPIWYASLGNMRSGESAGMIGFRRANFNNTDIFTPTGLIYEALDVSEVSVVRTSGILRQVYSREVLVDIQSMTSTKYKLDFFQRSQVTGVSGGLYTWSGSSFVTYTVEQRTVSGGTGVTITCIEHDASGDVTWETSLELVGSVTTGTWTHRDWRLTTAPSSSKVTTDFSTSPVTVTHAGRNVDNTADENALVWKKAFQLYSWGQELDKTTLGPSETVKVETQYSYYTTTASDGSVTRELKWKKFPNGSWVKNEYYHTSGTSGAFGMLKRSYQPWKNAPTSPDSASTSTSTYEDWTYAVNLDGMYTLPASRKRYAPGGTLISESAWTYALSGGGSYNGHTLSTATQKDFWGAGGTDCLTTTRYYHRDDNATRYFRGKPASMVFPDGRKEAFVYLNGDWTAATRTFTASSGGADRLILAFHGQSTAGAQSPVGVAVSSWTNNGQTWNFPSLYMAPTRSTVSELVVDTTGRTVFTAENVYTNSGTLVRIAGTAFSYDNHGRPDKEVDIIRSVSSSEFKTTRTYIAGLVDKSTAADGVVSANEYDSLLRVSKRTVGFGGSSPYPAKVEEVRYDGANRVAKVYPFSTSTWPTITEYDGAGRVKKQKSPKPNGGSATLDTEFTYDAVYQTTIKSPAGATTVTENYLDGRLKSISGTAQAPANVDYDFNTTGPYTTRKNGATLNEGWATEQYDRLGRTTVRSTPTTGYDSSSAPTKIIDAELNYNSAGQLWRERTKYRLTSAYLSADRIRTFDAAGRVLWEGLDVDNSQTLTTGGNDRITAYDGWFAADGWGWLRISTVNTCATLNSSTATQLSYVSDRVTGFNNSSLSSGRFAIADSVSFDATGRYTIRWLYADPTIKRATAESILQGSSTLAYDHSDNGYRSETGSLTGVREKFEYDTYGRLQYDRTRWNGSSYDATTTYAYYDATDAVSAITAGGITTSYAYAWNAVARTQMTTVTDAASKTNYTMAEYDPSGLRQYTWGSAAQPAKVMHDVWGRPTTMTTWRGPATTGDFASGTWPSNPGTGATTTWNLEGATGLLLNKAWADHTTGAPRKWTYTYSPLGQPSTRTWARGSTTTYTYFDGSTTGTSDVSHRTQELRQVTYSDGTPTLSYTYKRTGAPDQVTDATGARSFSYRSDLQLDFETLNASFYGSNRTMTSVYENGSGGTVNGRARGIEFRTGSTVEAGNTFTYDGNGRVGTVASAGGTNTFTYGYTTPGTDWVTTITSGSFVRTNSLLPDRGALDKVETKWSTTTLGLYDATWNSRGLRDTVVQSGSVVASSTNAFAYNDRGELTGADNNNYAAKDFTWGYDLMGKRTTANNNGAATTYTASTDAAKDVNQYASITGETGLAYDADGNMTVDGTWNYAYDAENRLIRMDRKDALLHLYFTYDYMGRRVQKTVRNSSFAVTSSTKFLYSGWRLSTQLDAGTATTGTTVAKTFLWGADFSGGAGAGGLLAVRQGGSNFYPVYDVQGNVTGYFNPNDTLVHATYEYNAYGQLVAQGGAYDSFNFGFSTQYTDWESGLVYYGLRYYSPKHGRFINRDPIEESGGLNLYSIVGNNPANRWDTLGLLNDESPDDSWKSQGRIGAHEIILAIFSGNGGGVFGFLDYAREVNHRFDAVSVTVGVTNGGPGSVPAGATVIGGGHSNGQTRQRATVTLGELTEISKSQDDYFRRRAAGRAANSAGDVPGDPETFFASKSIYQTVDAMANGRKIGEADIWYEKTSGALGYGAALKVLPRIADRDHFYRWRQVVTGTDGNGKFLVVVGDQVANNLLDRLLWPIHMPNREWYYPKDQWLFYHTTGTNTAPFYDFPTSFRVASLMDSNLTAPFTWSFSLQLMQVNDLTQASGGTPVLTINWGYTFGDPSKGSFEDHPHNLHPLGP